MHAAWCRLGWPRTFGGKLWLGALAAAALPVATAALAWQTWGAGSPLWAWLTAGLILSAALGALLARSLAAPLRRAASSLPGVGTAATGLDDAAALEEQVPLLTRQSAMGRAALASISAVDDLTGLPNRLEAFERLRHTLSLAARDHLAVSAALVDVDQLEAINDRWGRSAGDSVLLGVGNRLEHLLRGGDWAARWEDDAFLLVLFSDVEGAQAALERLRTGLGELRVVTDHYQIRCTVSLGASQARTEDRVQEWVERVEVQLARAKESGPGGLALDL